MVLSAVIKLFRGPFLHLECLKYSFQEISVVVITISWYMTGHVHAIKHHHRRFGTMLSKIIQFNY